MMNMVTGPESGQVTLMMDATLAADAGSGFRQMIREALNRSPRELLLDCTLLNYIDSTGLGLLTLARTEAGRLGCKVRLVNVVGAHTRKVLELMRFDQIFEVVYGEAKGC